MLAVFSSVIFTDVFAESLIVNFDKQFYDLGDSLIISGEIPEVGMPVIAMSIYDPDGKILSANNLEISSEKTFSKTISLDSPFYEKTGEYLLKLDYGQISENYYFMVEGTFSESEILIEETVEPEVILLYTEQRQYTDKDVVKITGLVSAMDSPTVLIGIYDPFGMPAGFYFGSVDSNLEFTTNFLVKDGVNFRVDGTYSVKAHYAETEATSFFDYYKISPIIVKDSLQDKIKEQKIEDEKINSSLDQDIPNDENKTVSEKQTSDDFQNVAQSDIPVNNPQKTKSFDTIITKNVLDESLTKKVNIVENKETKIIQKNIQSPIKIKKENNLSVGDIELGKLLNQIKLECDSSTYTDTISYYDGMGPALYRLCKFDSSLNFFNESLTKTPNNVEILVNKGSTLGKMGYFSEAIVYYDHAIRVDPNFLPAKNNKANALANLGNFKDAILLYDEVLEQNPNYQTARENLGIVLSSNFNISAGLDEFGISNTSIQKSIEPGKITLENSEKQKSGNFFDEVGIAFSTLGSLFGFLK